jgi:hypothetical protein
MTLLAGLNRVRHFITRLTLGLTCWLRAFTFSWQAGFPAMPFG